MFDLPVLRKTERKAASKFRKDLLDFGFEMSQFSVYVRNCLSASQVNTITGEVEAALPIGGKVSIIQFTDKQFQGILNFHAKKKMQPKAAPGQFQLF
jgi:CRISPR-associated protein Cas2